MRPYIICHMVTSVDGKVTGDFLSRCQSEEAIGVYYELNRSIRSNGFICGRVTMEGSFTGGWYPELSDFEPLKDDGKTDYIPGELSGFYAVAFDTNGRLGWKSNKIIDPDGDPGYDGAQIIEVISENADPRYLSYLRKMEIPYIFAGKEKIDVAEALYKLKHIIGAETLLLEGGSIINGAFQRADAVDELSLVVAPVVAEAEDKPLFFNSTVADFELAEAEKVNNTVVLRYKKKSI